MSRILPIWYWVKIVPCLHWSVSIASDHFSSLSGVCRNSHHGEQSTRRRNNQPLPGPSVAEHLAPRHRIALIPNRVANLAKLQAHQIIMHVPARIYVRQHPQRLVMPSNIDQPARALGHPRQQADTQQGPDALQETRQPPCPGRARHARRGAVGDTRCDEGTDVEEVVEERQPEGALVPWEQLGEVGGGCDGGGGGAEADENAGDVEHGDVLGSGLQGGGEEGDGGGVEEGGAPPILVGQPAPEEAGYYAAYVERCDIEGAGGGREVEVVIVLGH